MPDIDVAPDILIEELDGESLQHTFINIHTREIKHYENGEPMRVGTERPECPYCGERLSHTFRCASCEKLVTVRRVYTTVGTEPEGDQDE